MKILSLLLLILSLSSCSESGKQQTLNNDSPDSSDKLVCNEPDTLSCLPLITETSDKEYIYRDSFNDDSFPSSGDPYQYLAPHSLIDLKQIDSGLNLSQHFKVRELMRLSSGPYALFSTSVLYHLERIRERVGFPLKINSGYRSPAHNAKVGGSTWSRHIYGDAVDISALGENRDQIIKVCKDLGATYTEKYINHVHCDWRSEALDLKYYPQIVRPDFHIHQVHNQNLDFKLIKTTQKAFISIEGFVGQENSNDIAVEWVVKNLSNGLVIKKEATSYLEFNIIPGDAYHIKAKVGGNEFIQKELSF